MIQNFRKEIIQSPTLELSGIQVFLKLDSNNRIYQFFYSGEGHLDQVLDKVGTYIQDKNIEALIDSFARDFMAICKRDEENFDSFHLYQTVFLIKRLFSMVIGEPFAELVDSDNLICRCFGVDKKQLSELFNEHKGEIKPAVLASDASLGCGQCSTLLKKVWSEFKGDSEFYNGLTKEEMTKSIHSHMTEFLEYSNQDLTSIELHSILLEKNEITFRVSLLKDDFNLVIFKNQVLNFLSSRIGFLPIINLAVL